jgi:glutaredoxin
VIVTLYGKVGCCLCDEAREAIDDVATEIDFELREIDILGDPELFAQYRYRIPVVLKDGREIAEGRISALELSAALSSEHKG